MKYFDPRSRSDKDYQKEVEDGKIESFKRSDVGGVYKYKKTLNGDTLIKDIEHVDNSKGYQQTDFTVRGGHITEIRPHNDY